MQSLADIITVLIGMVFVYLILSMVVSYLVELVSGWLNWRGRILADALQLLLNPSARQLEGARNYQRFLDQKLSVWYADAAKDGVNTPKAKILQAVQANLDNTLGIFYTHPTITTLARPGKLPAYIDPDVFSTALMDLLVLVGGDGSTSAAAAAEMTPEAFLHQLENGLDCLGNEPLKAALLPYIRQAEITEQAAEKRIAAIRDGINNWFNSTMDRASGWYKRNTQKIAIGFSLLVVLAVNADTINIFQRLWQDANLRSMVNTAAVEYVRANPAGAVNPAAQGAPVAPEDAVRQLQRFQSVVPLPLGWSRFPIPVLNEDGSPPADAGSVAWIVFVKLMGLTVTVLAISQGSSIWFQTLSRLINLRNVGVKPDSGDSSSTETASARIKPGRIAIDTKSTSTPNQP